jgi:hypothetical protein
VVASHASARFFFAEAGSFPPSAVSGDMMILAATSSALGLIASGPLPPPTPPRSALAFGSRRAAAIRAESATGGTFVATIELGEGDGTVVHEFDPYFSSSTLITMRYPVPYTLEASPLQGVIKVTESGDGLIEGDVLRAFSTLQLRCGAAADPDPDTCGKATVVLAMAVVLVVLVAVV